MCLWELSLCQVLCYQFDSTYSIKSSEKPSKTIDEETELQRHHGACPNASDNEKWSMDSYQIQMPLSFYSVFSPYVHWLTCFTWKVSKSSVSMVATSPLWLFTFQLKLSN